jgi:MFS family permease
LLVIIEGIAEGTAAIMKFLFGYLSDRMYKRKVFVILGYSFAAVSKVLIALASSWPLVLFARFIDRTGKGLRTSARDALLLQSATPQNKGFIFGFHRSMDSAGAVFGPLVGLLLLAMLKENIRLTFYFAFIPAAIAVILLVIFVHEKKQSAVTERQKIKWQWGSLDPKFKFFFLISMLFALGNSSDVFLILRAKDLGLTTTLTVLAYVLYNTFQTVFATPGGQLADKIGARRVFSAGLLIFSLVYLLFGLITHSVWVWVLFAVYGVYIAFTDGVSKAYIAEFITEREAGTYYGLYQMGIAFATFFASFIGGILWSSITPAATFYYGAFLAFAAFLLLLFGQQSRKV